MKKSLLAIFFATCTIYFQAQQDAQFTQWQFDRLSFNPAAAGIDCMHCLSVFHRDQWDGFEHDPKTYLINYSGLFGEGKITGLPAGLGIGATFLTERLGNQENIIFRVSAAPKIALNNGSIFSAGISLGLVSSKLGANWIAIDPDDPSVPDNGISGGAFDLGLGITFSKKGQYYVGASATHLTASEIPSLKIKNARHFYFMGGYEYALGSSSLVLRPNLLLKTDFNATAFDINADVLWNNILWGGLAFRPGDAIAPYVGFQKSFAPVKLGPKADMCEHGVKIGYSYDVTTSDIATYSNGSHEIFVSYCMKICPIIIKAKNHNPRFL